MANSLMEKSKLVESLTLSHQEELTHLRSQLERSRNDHRGERLKVSELEHTISALNRDNAAIAARCQSFEEQIGEMSLDKLDIQQSGQDGNKLIHGDSGSSLKVEIESMKASHNALLARYHCVETEAKDLRKGKEELERRMSQLETERDESNDAHLRESKTLIESEQILKQELLHLRQSIQSGEEKLQLQIQEFRTLSEELKAQNSQLAEDNECLKKHLAEIMYERDTIAKENSEINGELSKLKADVVSISEELDITKELVNEGKLSAANDTKQRLILENEVKELSAHNVGLASEMQHKTQQMTELQQQLVNIHTAHEQLQSQQQQLEVERDNQRLQVAELNDNLEDVRAARDELQSDCDRLTEENRAANASLELLRQQQIADLNSRQLQSSEVRSIEYCSYLQTPASCCSVLHIVPL